MGCSRLADRLRNARMGLKLTLRDVERLTGSSVLHPYLCHLENAKIIAPDPARLRALSEVLRLDYLELLILAGHLTIRELKSYR